VRADRSLPEFLGDDVCRNGIIADIKNTRGHRTICEKLCAKPALYPVADQGGRMPELCEMDVVDKLTPEQKASLEAGTRDGLAKIKHELEAIGRDENGWHIATNLFGSRQILAGNWMLRAAAAMGGIYGNDVQEALYPFLVTDSDGPKPNCATNRYTLRFPRRAAADKRVLVRHDV
jgi:hypothetical protein